MSHEVHYFDQGNRLTQDNCAILSRDLENQSISEYMIFNPFNVECTSKDPSQVKNFAFQYPNLRFRDGYGVASCAVDNDSKLRYETDIRSSERQQLNTRVFQAVPNFARGVCAPNTESFLVSGNDTKLNKPCNPLSERNFDRFMPFIGCMQDYVDQRQESLGNIDVTGKSSRDFMRREDALRACAAGKK